jgi:hypothetical protein
MTQCLTVTLMEPPLKTGPGGHACDPGHEVQRGQVQKEQVNKTCTLEARPNAQASSPAPVSRPRPQCRPRPQRKYPLLKLRLRPRP